MEINYIINEMLKKIDYVSTCIEASKIKELDNNDINRL